MSAVNDEVATDSVSSPDASSQKKSPQWDPDQNHGRHGVDAYSGCDQEVVSHPDLSVGSTCPDCVECSSEGRLYAVDPGEVIVLKGQAIITGTRYQIEKLRCGLCGQQFSAPLPKEANRPKYDATSRSALAMTHYYFGFPFKRIETLQAMHNIPVPDATQWDQMQVLYDIVQPVHAALEKVASNGDRFFYDDTPNRLLKKGSFLPGRKGIYTTAIAAFNDEEKQKIFLFYTSQRHAGENIKALLKARDSNSKFSSMTDASPSNIPKMLPENLLANWIFCFCLVHGRRKFYELYHLHEGEVRFVLDQIGIVYDNERYCKNHGYTDEQRLSHHQQYSAPAMELLKIWLTNQLLFHEVEPNTPLGEAITYLLKYWIPLTRFLHVVGVAIDNSLAERMIKVMIRYRKNSLFFRTIQGAHVGDVMMSLIHTARYNNVNAFDYLTILQDYSVLVAAAPEDWLPWNYQQSLLEVTLQEAA